MMNKETMRSHLDTKLGETKLGHSGGLPYLVGHMPIPDTICSTELFLGRGHGSENEKVHL